MLQRPATALFIAPILALFTSPAFAQSATDPFLVSITVENDCSIEVTDLSFGTVTDLTPAVDASTTGTVTCTSEVPVDIAFDVGTGGGSLLARQMEATGETIEFNLYRDAARTEILGDGDGGTFRIEMTSTGGADAFTVYGRTSPDQNPKDPGTYSSTITATVTF